MQTIEPWDGIDAGKYRDEDDALGALSAIPSLPEPLRSSVHMTACALVCDARQDAHRQGIVQHFLQEFSLSTAEGLALMGLAEALLRTPDAASKNRLILENICVADWRAHLGRSDSTIVNASSWALMVTGKWGSERSPDDAINRVRKLSLRIGEPVMRTAVAQAVRIMARQFVLGRTISDGLVRAKADQSLCSFDMLGEGARTDDDADRYEAAYRGAIQAVARAGNGSDPIADHGISIKLSALSPRFEATQGARLKTELYPRLLRLARLAAQANINFTLDAEEADRLVASLQLFDDLAREPSLRAWQGLGLAVQAYQKRALQVIAGLQTIARDNDRRVMLRLVKGAYWDSEIKRAQVAGLPDYPVFTTKRATDLSYLACARAILDAGPVFFGQFATHNAHTLAAVHAMASQTSEPWEFQRLHGMGETLFAAAKKRLGAFGLRVYAPIGSHNDLLPYLVRRLLENGANSSFVHLLMDQSTPIEAVISDPFAGTQTRGLAKPADLYGDRMNSAGFNLAETDNQTRLADAIAGVRRRAHDGRAIVSGCSRDEGATVDVRNPFDRDERLGTTAETSQQQIDAAFRAATRAFPVWSAQGGKARAQILRAMGDALEAARLDLAALCILEAGKTGPDAIAEVREAIDFCRYYAELAEAECEAPKRLKGPAGELNTVRLEGRGVFGCISPWNFPLAIFTGQIAAALAAGNAVLAKPAEQTPLIAAMAVRLFHKAGLPVDILHLVPGKGETVGTQLIRHPDLAGVAFTGGTDTARLINRTLALRDGPIVPFIAETGGLNGMFVDTTAQREQVIDDVLQSAFGAAGQRCSALRLLFLPHETADALIKGISGAMAKLVVGDPILPQTDIGPVIDETARAALEQHLTKVRGTCVARAPLAGTEPLLFAPTLIEIGTDALPDREVFGPILHVVRYRARELESVAAALRAKGYGLTLGVHSRLSSFAARIQALVPAGNTYINRSIVGAVVGVQPFGGEGLSGTGPKAGGPLALYRYTVERALSVNTAARGGDPALLAG